MIEDLKINLGYPVQVNACNIYGNIKQDLLKLIHRQEEKEEDKIQEDINDNKQEFKWYLITDTNTYDISIHDANLKLYELIACVTGKKNNELLKMKNILFSLQYPYVYLYIFIFCSFCFFLLN